MQQPLLDPTTAAVAVGQANGEQPARGNSGSSGGGSGGATATASASVLGTALNIANTLEGMGLLGLPFAVRLAGARYTLGALAVVCAASCWTAIVIAATLYDPKRTTRSVGRSNGGGVVWVRARASYVENATAAFGTTGGMLTLVIQTGTLIAVSSIFLVLVGNSLADPDVMPTLLGARANSRLLELARPFGLGADRLWTVMCWVVVVPTTWAPGLRQISWLSGAGVVLLLGLVALVLVAAVRAAVDHGDGDSSSGTGHHSSGSMAGLGSGTAAQSLWHQRLGELPEDAAALRALPCAFAMVAFSFSCHNMIPGFEEGMFPSDRHRFPAVVAATFCCCAALKAIFLGAAWLAFGGGTPQVVITALEPLGLRTLATAALALNTVLTLPTFLFILQAVLAKIGGGGAGERPLPPARTHGTRVVLLLLILALAVAVPRLPAIMSWVGSTATPAVVFVLPLAFHLKLRWRDASAGLYSAARLCVLCVVHALVLAVGLTGAVLGVWVSVDGTDRCSGGGKGNNAG
eukprot:COSAG01_NODE_7201_length_3306_cov_59.287496_3_plen_520_part_00